MDNYIEYAKKYLARKESLKRNILAEICKIDYEDIDKKWDD